MSDECLYGMHTRGPSIAMCFVGCCDRCGNCHERPEELPADHPIRADRTSSEPVRNSEGSFGRYVIVREKPNAIRDAARDVIRARVFAAKVGLGVAGYFDKPGK